MDLKGTFSVISPNKSIVNDTVVGTNHPIMASTEKEILSLLEMDRHYQNQQQPQQQQQQPQQQQQQQRKNPAGNKEWDVPTKDKRPPSASLIGLAETIAPEKSFFPTEDNRRQAGYITSRSQRRLLKSSGRDDAAQNLNATWHGSSKSSTERDHRNRRDDEENRNKLQEQEKAKNQQQRDTIQLHRRERKGASDASTASGMRASTLPSGSNHLNSARGHRRRSHSGGRRPERASKQNNHTTELSNELRTAMTETETNAIESSIGCNCEDDTEFKEAHQASDDSEEKQNAVELHANSLETKARMKSEAVSTTSISIGLRNDETKVRRDESMGKYSSTTDTCRSSSTERCGRRGQSPRCSVERGNRALRSSSHDAIQRLKERRKAHGAIDPSPKRERSSSWMGRQPARNSSAVVNQPMPLVSSEHVQAEAGKSISNGAKLQISSSRIPEVRSTRDRSTSRGRKRCNETTPGSSQGLTDRGSRDRSSSRGTRTNRRVPSISSEGVVSQEISRDRSRSRARKMSTDSNLDKPISTTKPIESSNSSIKQTNRDEMIQENRSSSRSLVKKPRASGSNQSLDSKSWHGPQTQPSLMTMDGKVQGARDSVRGKRRMLKGLSQIDLSTVEERPALEKSISPKRSSAPVTLIAPAMQKVVLKPNVDLPVVIPSRASNEQSKSKSAGQTVEKEGQKHLNYVPNELPVAVSYSSAKTNLQRSRSDNSASFSPYSFAANSILNFDFDDWDAAAGPRVDIKIDVGKAAEIAERDDFSVGLYAPSTRTLR